MTIKVFIPILASSIVFSLGCASPPSSIQPQSHPTTAQIDIIVEEPQLDEGMGYFGQFWPGEISVPTGTTITWTNTDKAIHTVVSDDSLFKTSLSLGESFNYTFTQKGNFRYHEEPHGFFGFVYVE